jgi:hypothetical protein
MDAIDEVLTTQSLDSVQFDPSIWAALTLAKKTLNKYYNLTDDSEVFRIAMSMLSHLTRNVTVLLIQLFSPRSQS